MYQTIGEYIEENATFWSLENSSYYYVWVNGDEEILIATYYPQTGELEWENNEEVEYIRMNKICEYVKTNAYSYGGNGPRSFDVLMYSEPEEEIETLNV